MKPLEDRMAETVVGFLKSWYRRKPRRMRKYLQKTVKKNHRKGDLRRYLKYFPELISWEIDSVERKGEAMCDFYVSLRVEKDEWLAKHIKTFIRVIAEKKPYKPSKEGKPGVNPFSINLA